MRNQLGAAVKILGMVLLLVLILTAPSLFVHNDTVWEINLLDLDCIPDLILFST